MRQIRILFATGLGALALGCSGLVDDARRLAGQQVEVDPLVPPQPDDTPPAPGDSGSPTAADPPAPPQPANIKARPRLAPSSPRAAPPGGVAVPRFVDESPSTPAEPEPEFDQVAWPCCDMAALDDIIEEYLDLHDALADETERANPKSYALRGEIWTARKKGTLPSGERDAALEVIKELDRVRDGSHDDIRQGFAQVSEWMIRIARDHRGGDHRVAVAWDATTNNRWLQDDDTIRNPYAGPVALRRGVFQE